MSHLVLARKYRPRSFDQMVGQAHVVQALSNALTSGRLHHAYLFTGTRGIGKTTVSRILAKSLNCTGPDGTGGITAHPCGVCQACTEIDADRYIDYFEMDAASNGGKDEIRDLIERAAYKPSVGRFKVFMIDEAHQLSKDAFNALLKTLEEPPDYLKFVLATTDPEKMLPTVLSRCLQFNLRPMAPETVQQHLQQVLQAGGVAADAGALRLLSRAARGSMRDALSLTDQAIAFGAGSLEESGVRSMLGTVDRSHASALVGALARRAGPAVLATVQALRELGLSAAGTLEEMAALLQQMAVEQAVPGALDDTDPDTGNARALAAELPPDETQLLYSIVVHGRAELNLLADEYAALTMVLLRLLAFAPAGAAPVAAGTARAAPLVAAAREARSSSPARPVAAMLPPVLQAPAVQVSAVQVSAVQAPVVQSPVLQAPTRQPAGNPAPAAQAGPLPASAAAGALPAAQVSAAVGPRPSAPPRSDLPMASEAAPLTLAPVLAAFHADPDARPGVPATALSAREPPPWVDAALPDEDGSSSAAPAGDDEAPMVPRPLSAHSADSAAEGADQAVDLPTAVALISSISPISEAPAKPPGAQRPVPPALVLTVLGEQWTALIRPLIAAGSVAALVRELALQAGLLAVQPVPAADGGGRRWQLCVERETLRAPALAAKLAAALSEVLGEPVQLLVQAGVPQDSIARRDTLAREGAQRDAEQTIQNDPAVQALLAQFRTARIVPGSIKALRPNPNEPRTPSP